MSQISQRLLNDFQRNFPLVDRPYDQLANSLGVSADEVIEELQSMKKSGEISRIGPVFRPNTIGASTLAAMAVPEHDLDKVAEIVNQFSQVNHNYQREHAYNLWFVVTDASEQQLKQTLNLIEQATGFELISLPLLKGFFIDLGFDLEKGRHTNKQLEQEVQQVELPAYAESLIEVAQYGLPLSKQPYKEMGEQVGLSEQQVIDGLSLLVDSGVIKRLGVVVKHRKLGYQANAMVVWNIADHQLDTIGHQMGHQSCVNLCYQRPRIEGKWPYNLFCMVHGKNRDEVFDCIEKMRENLGLNEIEYDVLFSVHCYKQRGAVYRHGSA